MKTDRRRFLIGSGAAGLLGKIPMARAATEMGWASNFSSDTLLQNNGGIAGMTASSGIGCITFDWKVQRGVSGPGINIGKITQYETPFCRNFDRGLTCGIGTNSSGMGLVSLSLFGSLPSTCFGQKITTVSAPAELTEGIYYNTIISWDTAGVFKILINGMSLTPTITNYNGTPENADFSGPTNISGNGDITDIGVFAGGPFIEPGDLIDKLYNVESGYAVRNASNGPDINGRRPQIWLSGPPEFDIASNKWIWRNRAAGTWTWPGTYNDTSPTSDFTVVAGALQNSPLPDPFEPGSPT